jgi:hypothetical protein
MLEWTPAWVQPPCNAAILQALVCCWEGSLPSPPFLPLSLSLLNLLLSAYLFLPPSLHHHTPLPLSPSPPLPLPLPSPPLPLSLQRKFVLLNSRAEILKEGDTSRDELIAMAMQASFDDELSLSHDLGSEGDEEGDADFDSEGESLGSHDSDRGLVAAGGWRRRQDELDQETAEDYDVSCLETRTLSVNLDGSCAVCQCEWEKDDQVRVLPCEHQFHTACIDQWLRKHRANCPLCKKDVRQDWEDEEEEVWDPLTGTWAKERALSDEEQA